MPSVEEVPPCDNQPDAARRSVEEIVERAGAVDVQVALEVIPNPLSSAAALVRLIEDDLDGIDVGICLDYGHAHLMGDLGEAIETVSGHLVDDARARQRRQARRAPGALCRDHRLGRAMMETQKIGYDGVLMFEVGRPPGTPSTC